MQYPDWFMEMEGHTENPDDWSDGRLDEHKNLREIQLSIFGRLCCFKPLIGPILQVIVDQF